MTKDYLFEIGTEEMPAHVVSKSVKQLADRTKKYLKENGIKTRVKKKISEGSSEILDSIRKGHITYIVNTLTTSDNSNRDGYQIRRCAVENNVNVFTSLDTVNVLLNILEEITMQVSCIDD